MSNPLSATETEVRLLKIEIALNTIWGMLKTVINREQFNRLNIIRQKEIQSLEERLAQLDSDIATLWGKYNSLL